MLNTIQEMELKHMDPALYKAAVEGNINVFEEYGNPLDQLVTSTGNTVLHLCLATEDEKREFVERILNKCSSLLLQKNSKDETPLHIAARFGHYAVVKSLIERAKNTEDTESSTEQHKVMMRMTNKENDTALHEAIRYHRDNVVTLLIHEDHDYQYSANDYGETPLYMAALRGHGEMVDVILGCCSLVAYGGPHGRTALHAAAMCGHKVIIRKLIAKRGSLTKEGDKFWWTPLHYTVFLRKFYALRLLLELDKSAAYIGNKERKMIPLQVAVRDGQIRYAEEIISQCPDCCEYADNKGWTILHYAAISRKPKAMELFVKNPSFRYLVNEKDNEGNTFLHILAVSRPKFIDRVRDWCALDDNAINKQIQSVDDIRKNFFPDKKEAILRLLEDVGPGLDGQTIKFNFEDNVDKVIAAFIDSAKEYHLVVAALIATVTFAAGFTLPGGFKSDDKDPFEGTAILSRKKAFQAFVITNAIAMVLSCSAVFGHFCIALFPYRRSMQLLLFYWASVFTGYAMEAMVLAFVTGTYAVLSPSKGLATATCTIGLSFFAFSLYVRIKMIKMSRSMVSEMGRKKLLDIRNMVSEMVSMLC